MKVILNTDIVVIESHIENQIRKDVEIVLKAGTEVLLDPRVSIAWSGVIPFDIFPNEYNHLN